MEGVVQGCFLRDFTFLIKRKNSAIHRYHMLVLGGIDYAIELINLSIPDHISYSRRRKQNLKGRRHAAGNSRQKLLRDDRMQYRRKLYGNLMLLVRREDIDNTIDRVGGT